MATATFGTVAMMAAETKNAAALRASEVTK